MSRPGPANYTTNVNRAKTKKWVEAKSFSYDGDDWGDVDDYDEYGGYDEPEPEPAPKPTGLRQRGQSATQIPQEAYEARQDLYQSPVDSRQQYGNLSAPPPHQQQQQRNGARSFTNPQPQHHPALARTNSFDQEDEQSAFSAGGPRQYGPSESFNSPSPQGQIVSALDSQPGRQFQDYPVQPHAAPGRPPISGPGRSSMEGQRRYGEQTQSAGANYRGGSYNDQARQSATGSRSQSMASNNSAMDFHNRRDFSPSAMPPPLQTRGSPSPHDPDLSSTSRPPRKSSLSHGGTPTQPFPTEASPTIRDQGEAVSPARDRAGSGAGKALPFVRPAEIYRRMQEEKEKERQSQDSSRPSMDAILGGPNDRPSLGRSQDSEFSQRLKPTLDPVKERKSEYAIEGVNLQDQATPGEPGSMGAKTFEFPKRASNTGSHAPKSSLGPMLPDVSRVSGFGESFFGSTYEAGESSQDSFTGSPSPQPAPQFEKNAPVRNLQHQPSLGFTSAVHQAFDKAEDQVPPTPSSTQGSSVGRSTSGGTSTVSPIISRGPSTATENWNSRLPGIDSVSTPMIPEAAEGGSPRPLSSESLGTPTQITRKPSPSQHNVPPEAQEPPPSFIPGYRRNSDTPSLDNSPRRTPALETSRPLRQPQEIEIAAATPTDSSINASSGSQASEISPVENLGTEHIGEGSSHNPKAAPGRPTGYADTTISPISPAHDRFRGRTDSSSSSRVRNLADKFESGSRPGSAHSTTPRASVLGGNAQKKEDLPPPRPLADRMESFRPHLPGGWESSASIAPAAAFNNLQAPDVRQQDNQINSAPVHNSESPADTREMSEEKTTPTLDQQPSAVAQMKDASEEAFAAVAAAGSALAGAFGTAVGMEQHDSSPASTAEAPSNERVSQKGRGNDQSAIRSQGTLHPEASRPHMPAASDDETSTTAPTPLAQDPPRGLAAQQNEADDFSSPPMHQDVEESKSDADETKATKQPPALPLLSTDTRPQQYESDRLRKEIVRELIPMSASEPTTAETDYSNYQPTLSTNPSVSHPKHESGVLPKEYESYWNDAPSDDEVDQLNGSPDEVKDTTTPERQQDAAAVVSPLQPNQGHQRLPTASSPREEPPRGKSPMLPHRFSWEQPLHELPPQAEPAHEQPAATSSDFLKSAIYPDGHSRAQDEPPEDGSTLSPTTELDRIASESPRVSAKDSSVQGTNDLSGPETRGLGNTKESPNFPSGLELVSSPTGSQPQAFPIAERERSLDNVPPPSPVVHNELRQESEPPRIGHPFQTSSDIPAPSLDLPPMPAPGNAQPKIPAFREILALKSPAERIRAYDETRAQFANLNTGLANWLVSTVNDLPQHNDLLVRAGQAAPNFQGHKPSPSRSKLGGLLPSGGQSNQQPYFQQYLNASPGAAPPDGKAAGGTIGGGPSQGFQPSGGSGGKLSGQQVQAKGKDLLHTAGVFGGKANVAAKGLFSKGKSKLRAASGNEKV